MENAQVSIASCPEFPFFLKQEFLEEYWDMASLPPEKLSLTRMFKLSPQ